MKENVSTQLVQCPACGGSVSSIAKSCPHCAHPIRRLRLIKEFGRRKDASVEKARSWSLIGLHYVLRTSLYLIVFSLNEQGQVVGVIQSKIGSDSLVSTTDEQTQNVNYAVKIEHLRILADKVGVVPGALGVTTNATRHDVFNRVRAATVLLQAR